MSISEELDLQALLKLEFDPRALREKYRVERDRRLRSEGNKQYIKIEGEYSNFLTDHFAGKPVARDPLTLELDALVIGGGFAGLQTAARLRMAGVDDFRIVERASDFGGNWYWSRYPGSECDSEAYCYFPLLEETGYIPSSQYPDADEIHAHAQRIGRHFDLYDTALFQTTVNRMVWNEAASRWMVETDRGDSLQARFVVLSGGETFAFKLPGTPGINSFKGRSMHVFRWDYAYTGGSTKGNLHKLKDKRVAVIGTGCSSVQIVPHVGESAEHLYVFQRTPALVDPRRDSPTDPEWVKSLTPGWQGRRFEQLLMGGRRYSEDGAEERIHDNGFADQQAALQAFAAEVREAAEAADLELSPRDVSELANMRFMERVRSEISAIVKDPATAEALKPYYATWCKRPTWNSDYLPTFNRSNVTLVDTAPHGVEQITEKGLVANGVEYEVDLIIYGTGLEVGHSSLFRVAGFPVVGRDGVTLKERWADGFNTLHGMMVHKLPNYFQETVIGNGLGVNYLYPNGKQAAHIAWIIKHCLDNGYLAVEPTLDAEAEWRKTLDLSQSHEHNPLWANFLAGLAECTPGYNNSEGDATDRKGIFPNFYGFGALKYMEMLREWREGDVEMPGLAITRDSGRVPVG
jgi:cyclohexanone monooxygenase